MVDAAVKAGQEVRLPETHQRGWVVEVDHSLLVARVELNQGGEKWERLDALEVVEPWDNRRRTA
jgi:hypothetical protein